MESEDDVSLLEDLRARVQTRRVELQHEITEVLPAVERLHEEINNHREDIAKLERRRDVLAAFGAKPIPIPQPDAVVPSVGPYYTVEVEPLKSKLTGRDLAAKVQADIDDLLAANKASETEIRRLMRGRS